MNSVCFHHSTDSLMRLMVNQTATFVTGPALCNRLTG